MKKDLLKAIKEDMWNTLSNKKYLQAQLKVLLADVEQRRAEALAEDAALDVSEESKAYMIRHTNEMYDKMRVRVVSDEYERWHNDQSYYLIYKDGSEVVITAEEILGGEPFPKMAGIVYAEMSSADDHFDTETGDLDWYSDEAMEACDWNDEVEDERRWQYETAIQYKFGTEWSVTYAQKHPEFVPMQVGEPEHRFIKDNAHMTVTLDCEYAVTIHWDSKSYTVKTYRNKSGERYVNLHGKRWYL